MDEPLDAATRMRAVREGARRRAAHMAALAICTLELGEAARPGLEEDLDGSRLSVSDLEQLAATVIDHARDGSARAKVGPDRTSATALATLPVAQSGASIRHLWKYNVQPKHLNACITHAVFAENVQRNLVPGDLLLLQQTKAHAKNAHGRIAHFLIFDRYERDDTNLSTQFWGTRYRYLVWGRVEHVARPFSLEDLGLSKSYSQQGKIGPERIHDRDEPQVRGALGFA